MSTKIGFLCAESLKSINKVKIHILLISTNESTTKISLKLLKITKRKNETNELDSTIIF